MKHIYIEEESVYGKNVRSHLGATGCCCLQRLAYSVYWNLTLAEAVDMLCLAIVCLLQICYSGALLLSLHRKIHHPSC